MLFYSFLYIFTTSTHYFTTYYLCTKHCVLVFVTNKTGVYLHFFIVLIIKNINKASLIRLTHEFCFKWQNNTKLSVTKHSCYL